MKIPVLLSLVVLLKLSGATQNSNASKGTSENAPDGASDSSGGAQKAEECTQYNPFATTESSTIDLSRPEASSTYGSGYGQDSMGSKTYFPGGTINASSVVDGSATIWTGGKDEHAKFVEHHFKGNHMIIKIGIVTGNSGAYTYKFFEKNGQGWTSIAKEGDFRNKLESLKNEKVTTTENTKVDDGNNK